MALVNCSECGREISDQALSCPGCGAPLPRGETKIAKGSTPALGIAAVVLGLGAIIMPYFAAVFLVPVSLVCGFIAYRRGQLGLGGAGVILGLMGLVGVIYVSQQISSIVQNPFGRISLPQSLFAPAPIVTRAEYDQIREGMMYEEVRAIIGALGEELSRSDIVGHTTVMYSWRNANGSNMNAMFQNGRLVNKAQFGLP